MDQEDHRQHDEQRDEQEEEVLEEGGANIPTLCWKISLKVRGGAVFNMLPSLSSLIEIGRIRYSLALY